MRIEKIQNNLQKHIAEIIIRDIQDPKIGFITITGVKTSKDLDLATVYINVLGGDTHTQTSIDELTKASGFIKSKLAKKMQIRKIPKLKFVLDERLEHANKIENLINKAK